MTDRRPRAKINVPMCVACVLLCLTLFSLHFCGGLYAKYIVKDSGEDSARIAKFDISKDGAYFQKEFQIDTVPGTLDRTIRVVNNSEVAVSYIVTIENTTKNIPFAFSVNGSTPAQDKCVVASHLEAESENDITISAIWDEEGALEYMGMVDLVKLTIRAEQID